MANGTVEVAPPPGMGTLVTGRAPGRAALSGRSDVSLEPLFLTQRQEAT
jgi:hypothetical protein